MAYELDIHFEGTAPGIAEHHLSVSAFGAALSELLNALRRIATQMVSSATEGEKPRSGRFADPARNLDIELVTINGNSLGMHSVVAFREPPISQPGLPIWADLPERAGRELLDSIERESRGQLANSAVRKYLALLPQGLSRQEYNFHSNGQVIRKIEIGDVKLTSLPAELPYLREIEGDIVGVSFEPAKTEVRVKQEQGGSAALAAPAEDVEKALDMRHQKVRTLAVHTPKGTRLISIKRASDPRFVFDPQRVHDHIFSRWDNVLRALSK